MGNTRVDEIDMFRILPALSVVFFPYSSRGFAADVMPKVPYSLLAPISKHGRSGVEVFRGLLVDCSYSAEAET